MSLQEVRVSLEGPFLTKAMKSMMKAFVGGDSSDPLGLISGHNFSSSVPSCDLTLFFK